MKREMSEILLQLSKCLKLYNGDLISDTKGFNFRHFMNGLGRWIKFQTFKCLKFDVRITFQTFGLQDLTS